MTVMTLVEFADNNRDNDRHKIGYARYMPSSLSGWLKNKGGTGTMNRECE